MKRRDDASLAELTTLRLGGPAQELIEVETAEELIEMVREGDSEGVSPLLVAGGSNLVIADEGYPGTALLIATRGISVESAGEGATRLRVAAGEPWDELVARTVGEGLSGIECLSGIPGSTGATPIQNVGAYGQEVAQTLITVRAYDRASGETFELGREDCGFGYRTSAFKRSRRHLILEVTLELEVSDLSRPIAYAQLADALDLDVGEQAPLAEVREAVLELRRSKGMVLDPEDPDSVSAGSFFTNPILSSAEFEAVRERAAHELGEAAVPPSWAEEGGRIKTSAAWLIERAGYGRGYGSGRAGISSKHSLALINRGGASTAELLAVARELRDGVRGRFGVSLEVEPTLVGVEL